MKTIRIFFDEPKAFELGNIKPLAGIMGVYFIFLTKTEIQYPFKKSRLIYIGMSEKRTNSIGKRLSGHYDGTSGNPGLVNYRKVESLYFTYINFEMLKNTWQYRVEDLESYFILDFVKHYGVYPICNNKTGFEILKNELGITLEIDWPYFETKE
ncbi:MAG: hypothetical protein NT166_06890 [Candidatus Aminicenantes bacterium]|nr:hypothetical protein [Candidatus Aminicenantes bacterium]